MEYRISLTESAKQDLGHCDVYDQRLIAAGIMAHLGVDAEVRTRRKKPLRRNPISPWELRIDRFRVFYMIEEDNKVKVVAVANKQHNVLFIRGRKVDL